MPSSVLQEKSIYGRLALREAIPELRRSLSTQLAVFLREQRWFGGKARQIQSTEIIDVIPLSGESRDALVLIARVIYTQGGEDLYVFPVYPVDSASPKPRNDAARLKITTQSGAELQLADALKDERFLSLLLNAIQEKRAFTGEKGELRAFQTKAFSSLYPSSAGVLKPKPLTGEQSNSSIIYGERLILKFFRRIEEGINPELEIGTFLTEKAHYAHIAPLAGWLEYRLADAKPQNAEPMTQAILQAFVPNQGDAWRYTLKSLEGFYDAVATHEATTSSLSANLSQKEIWLPEFARESVGAYLDMAGLLARRTAELHLALATEPNDSAFAPEPFTREFQRALENSLVELTSQTFALLRQRIPELPEKWRQNSKALIDRQGEIERVFHSRLSAPLRGARIRVHGDYHLGQVLYTGYNFVIIDFEGEPARPLAVRRIKRSPLQDVAGMLRSFHYAAFAPLLGAAGEKLVAVSEVADKSVWAESWYSWVADRFLEEYFTASREAAYFPPDQSETKSLLQLYLLEKSVYELGYELNNRPTWVGIPLQGISRLLAE